MAASSTTSPSALPLLASYFAFCGIAYGGQGVLFAEILRVLGFSQGAYGSAELAPPLVGFFILLFGGPIARRVGKKMVALLGFALFAVAALMLSLAAGFWSFAAALIVLGGGYGAIEMAMNAAAMDWEAATGRPMMNSFHAAFSAGAITGAAAVGSFLEWGATCLEILFGFTLLCALLLLISLPVTFPRSAEAESPAGTLTLLWRHPLLRTLAAIGMLGAVGEAVANNWSVIHLRALGAPMVVGGGAYALFNAGMLAGRLANGRIVARAGATRSLHLSGLLLTIAGAVLLLTTNLPLAIAAFTLTGVAVAGIIPTVLSAAATAAPGRSGEVTGAIMGAIYLAFALCAPAVGWFAELTNLHLALSAVALSGLAILALSNR